MSSSFTNTVENNVRLTKYNTFTNNCVNVFIQLQSFLSSRWCDVVGGIVKVWQQRHRNASIRSLLWSLVTRATRTPAGRRRSCHGQQTGVASKKLNVFTCRRWLNCGATWQHNCVFFFLAVFVLVSVFGRPIGQAYAIGNPSVCLSVTLVYCGQTA